MKLKNTKQHKHATNEEHDQFIFTTSINTFKILEVKCLLCYVELSNCHC